MIRAFIRDNRRYAARSDHNSKRSPRRPGKSYNAAEQQESPANNIPTQRAYKWPWDADARPSVRSEKAVGGKIDFTIQLVENSIQSPGIAACFSAIT
jgi:hypothetical protein